MLANFHRLCSVIVFPDGLTQRCLKLELWSRDGAYRVLYAYEALSDAGTRMQYHGWVHQGVLDQPFTPEVSSLLTVLESSKPWSSASLHDEMAKD